MNESVLDLFLKACGAESHLVLERRNHGRAERAPTIHEFGQPFLMVGRDPRSDLRLEDSDVSRLHAYFQVVDGRLFCLDLLSRTGLAWSDRTERVAWGWLDPGQAVDIGGYSLRRIVNGSGLPFAAPAGERAAASPMEANPTAAAPEAALQLPIKTSKAGSLWRIPSALALIGRADECQLTLLDESISRLHASFIRTRSGLWVVDLGSREGVVVGGVRVRWAWLDEGDAVQIGRFTFIVRYPEEASGLSRRDVPISAGAMPLEPGQSSPPHSSGGNSLRTGRELATRPLEYSGQLMPVAHVHGQAAAAAPGRMLESVLPWQSPVQSGPAQATMWQQQMQLMESFHNDMILLVQMFVAMHREYLSTVPVELDRVEQLTRELSGLQEKLTRAEPAASGREPGAAEGDGAESGRAGMSSRATPAASRGPKPSIAPETRVDARGGASEVHRPASGVRGPLQASNPVEAHGLLTERIAMLQRERQGYWRRIISQISK